MQDQEIVITNNQRGNLSLQEIEMEMVPLPSEEQIERSFLLRQMTSCYSGVYSIGTAVRNSKVLTGIACLTAGIGFFLSIVQIYTIFDPTTMRDLLVSKPIIFFMAGFFSFVGLAWLLLLLKR